MSHKNKKIPTHNKQPNTIPDSHIWIIPTDADSPSNERWRMVIGTQIQNTANISKKFSLINYENILDQSSYAQHIYTFNLAPCFYPKDNQNVDRDNIKLYANRLEEHVNKFRELAKELMNAGLTLDTDTCKFLIKNELYKREIIKIENIRMRSLENNTQWNEKFCFKISKN